MKFQIDFYPNFWAIIISYFHFVIIDTKFYFTEPCIPNYEVPNATVEIIIKNRKVYMFSIFVVFLLIFSC
jgi:hypothetical protein